MSADCHPDRPVDAVGPHGGTRCAECNPWGHLRTARVPARHPGAYGPCTSCGRITYPTICRDCTP